MSQPKSTSEYRVALRAAQVKNARLEAENAQLRERVRKLEAQLEAAQRAAKRQAVQFSRGKRKPTKYVENAISVPARGSLEGR